MEVEEEVNTVLESVYDACSKLVNKGHEFFMIMSNPVQTYQIGSGKGMNFLENSSNKELVQSFFHHCYEMNEDQESFTVESQDLEDVEGTPKEINNTDQVKEHTAESSSAKKDNLSNEENMEGKKTKEAEPGDSSTNKTQQDDSKDLKNKDSSPEGCIGKVKTEKEDEMSFLQKISLEPSKTPVKTVQNKKNVQEEGTLSKDNNRQAKGSISQKTTSPQTKESDATTKSKKTPEKEEQETVLKRSSRQRTKRVWVEEDFRLSKRKRLSDAPAESPQKTPKVNEKLKKDEKTNVTNAMLPVVELKRLKSKDEDIEQESDAEGNEKKEGKMVKTRSKSKQSEEDASSSPTKQGKTNTCKEEKESSDDDSDFMEEMLEAAIDDEDDEEDKAETQIKNDDIWVPPKTKGRKKKGKKRGPRKTQEMLQCEKCDRQLMSVPALKRHMLIHDLKCKFCGEEMPDEETMMAHRKPCWKKAFKEKKKNNTEEPKHGCNKCPKMCFSPGALSRHMKNHRLDCYYCGERFKDEKEKVAHKLVCAAKKEVLSNSNQYCEICKRSFPNKGSLVAHSVIHTRPQNLICNFCNEPFDSHALLLEHLEKCESKDKSKDEEDTSKFKIYDSFDEIPVDGLQCLACDRTFKTQTTLIAHKIKHTKHSYRYTCKFCNKIFANASSKCTHEKTVHTQDKSFVCSVCSLAVKTKSSLKKHMLLHNIGKKYTCDTCSRSFICRTYLMKHMEIHKERTKDFHCPKCDSSFYTETYLKNHLRFTHVETRDHICDICGKAYKKSNYLADHMICVHGKAEDKKHPCDICGKRYLKRSEMLSHRRVHTGEKNFVCEDCGSSFIQKGNLDKHRRSAHRKEDDIEFQCEICNKRFNLVENYRLHMRLEAIRMGKIDTFGKPFGKYHQCKTCNRYFASAVSLHLHMRSHSGERPYSCTDCGGNFISSSKLSRHKKFHCKFGANEIKPRRPQRPNNNSRYRQQLKRPIAAVENLMLETEIKQEVIEERAIIENIEQMEETVQDNEANIAANTLIFDGLSGVQQLQYIDPQTGQTKILMLVNPGKNDTTPTTDMELVVIDSTSEEVPVSTAI